MTSPFPLLSFPEEIIENICWQLLGHPNFRSFQRPYDPKSVSHLCRASKTLHRIGTPVLYAYFEAYERLKRLADFLRTIIHRPELGALVQEINFNTFYWCELEKSHTDAFESAAARLGVSLDGWMENNQFEAIVQLTIAHTPNVRSIEVVAHEVYCDDGVGSFTLLEKMAAQVPRQVSLPRLRRLYVGHDDCRRISLGYFGGILELAPNVREIIGDPIYGAYCDEPNVNNRMILDNVTSLQLKGGHITRHQLQEMVSRCRALEHFTYKYHSIYAGLEICVTPREVIEALRQCNHNNTLRSIRVDMGYRERRSPDDLSFTGKCDDGEQILSLKDFSRLETFHVDGTSVLFPTVETPGYSTDILTKMLPGSIRRFQLTHAAVESAANLISLAQLIADFPLLEEVSLTGNSAEGPLGDKEVEFDESEITVLRNTLEDNGVRFNYTFTNDDDD
ncbi:hypothetical protein TrVFT333_008639 [Trichoderma virens FT-333]|nr:hypothetical protein TrVFT333_008639 [Trichoderma virens FT-333]